MEAVFKLAEAREGAKTNVRVVEGRIAFALLLDEGEAVPDIAEMGRAFVAGLNPAPAEDAAPAEQA